MVEQTIHRAVLVDDGLSLEKEDLKAFWAEQRNEKSSENSTPNQESENKGTFIAEEREQEENLSVKGAWGQLKAALKQAAARKKEAAANGIKGVFNQIGQSASNTAKATRDKFNQAMRPAKIVGRAAANTFVAGAGYVVQKSKDGYDTAKAGINKSGEALKHVGIASWKKTSEFMGKVGDAYTANAIENRKMVRNAVRSVTSKAKDLKDRAVFETNGFFSRMGQSASEKGKFLSEKFKSLMRPARIVGKAAGNLFMAGAGKTVGAVNRVGKGVASKAVSAYSQAQQFTKQVGDVSKQKAQELKDKAVSYKDTVERKAHRHKVACKFVARQTARSFKDGAKNVYLGGKDLGKAMVRGIAQGKEKVSNTFSAMRMSIIDSISKMKDNVKTSIKERASHDTMAVYRAAKMKASAYQA